MAADPTLLAEPRPRTGSAESRRLRNRGVVPGVVYGHGEGSVGIAVPAHDLAPILQSGHQLVDLSLDGGVLFVCNDRSGFTVYDVSDPRDIRELAREPDVMAWDAIADDGHLIVVGTDEVVQYDYSSPTRLVELSRLPYSRN